MIRFCNPTAGMLASALANCPNDVVAQTLEKPRLNKHLKDEDVAGTILDAINALCAPVAEEPDDRTRKEKVEAATYAALAELGLAKENVEYVSDFTRSLLLDLLTRIAEDHEVRA